MRTTVRLDDDLARAAKASAAEQGITFTQLIDESLRERLSRRVGPVREPSPVLPTYGRGGTLVGVDIRDNRAIGDLMDDEASTVGEDRPAKRRSP